MPQPSASDIATSFLESPGLRSATGRIAPRDELERALDVALDALLFQEESRQPRFSLLLIDPVDLLGLASGPYRILTFAEPITFDPRTLAHLCLATDIRHSSLVVSRRDTRSDLAILGMLSHAQSVFEEFRETYPPHTAIRGLRPGGLVISQGGVPRTRVMRGRIHRIDDTRGTGAAPAHDHLGLGGVAHDIVLTIGERIARSEHGGTLIFSSDPSALGRDVDVRRRFVPIDETVSSLVREHVAPRGEDRTSRKSIDPIALEHAVTHCAALANVDGAVVLDLDLRIHGFNAIVSMTRGGPSFEVEVHDQFEGVVRIVIAEGGTRHKSAAAFCHGATTGEVRSALVASQDRMVSTFYSRYGRVHQVRDLLLPVV